MEFCLQFAGGDFDEFRPVIANLCQCSDIEHDRSSGQPDYNCKIIAAHALHHFTKLSSSFLRLCHDLLSALMINLKRKKDPTIC